MLMSCGIPLEELGVLEGPIDVELDDPEPILPLLIGDQALIVVGFSSCAR